MKRAVLVSFAVVLVALGAESEAAKSWWSHVQYLADDKLEGRNTGSAGYKKAAEYVSQEFERAGLAAAGTNGYYQPVKFVSLELQEEKSSLAIVRGGKAQAVRLGEEAVITMRADPAPKVEAKAVFVGYGLHLPEAGFDDLKGVDLKGKIAVYVTGGAPAGISAALLAHAQSSSERWGALKAAGAVGVASIGNPKTMDIPWERSSLSRFMPSMHIDDPKMQDSGGMQVNLGLNAAHADMFLNGSGHTWAELQALLDAKKPLPHFELPLSFRVVTGVKKGTAESPNVVALRKGSDPALSNEVLVLSAHLDHIGVGKPINGDAIYNGAMDNASGIATLIEIARRIHKENPKMKRSIAFVAVCGEEKGLQGSKYFANHPSLKGMKIVGNVNLDMFLPLHALKVITVYGLVESNLGDEFATVAKAAGIAFQPDPQPERNLFIRSDQYSFIRQGVPALSFKFGFAKGSEEEKIQKDWLTNRYHAPSDDLGQPVNKEGAAQFTQLLGSFAIHVANMPARPVWKKDSFFRRYSKESD